MNGGQITYIVLMALSLGLALERHGKERTSKNNFWVELIAVGIQVAILWWGGFWT